MLDKILFWVVLIWMIGMLVMAFIAVREVWRDSNVADDESVSPEPAGPATDSAGGNPPDA